MSAFAHFHNNVITVCAVQVSNRKWVKKLQLTTFAACIFNHGVPLANFRSKIFNFLYMVYICIHVDILIDKF